MKKMVFILGLASVMMTQALPQAAPGTPGDPAYDGAWNGVYNNGPTFKPSYSSPDASALYDTNFNDAQSVSPQTPSQAGYADANNGMPFNPQIPSIYNYAQGVGYLTQYAFGYGQSSNGYTSNARQDAVQDALADYSKPAGSTNIKLNKKTTVQQFSQIFPIGLQYSTQNQPAPYTWVGQSYPANTYQPKVLDAVTKTFLFSNNIGSQDQNNNYSINSNNPYSTLYETTYALCLSGAQDANTDGKTQISSASPTFQPNYRSTDPNYKTIYDTVFNNYNNGYTDGSNDSSIGSITAPAYQSQDATYQTAYNAGFYNVNRGINDGNAAANHNASAAPTVPVTVPSPSLYNQAAIRGFYRQRANIDSQTDALAYLAPHYHISDVTYYKPAYDSSYLWWVNSIGSAKLTAAGQNDGAAAGQNDAMMGLGMQPAPAQMNPGYLQAYTQAYTKAYNLVANAVVSTQSKFIQNTLAAIPAALSNAQNSITDIQNTLANVDPNFQPSTTFPSVQTINSQISSFAAMIPTLTQNYNTAAGQLSQSQLGQPMTKEQSNTLYTTVMNLLGQVQDLENQAGEFETYALFCAIQYNKVTANKMLTTAIAQANNTLNAATPAQNQLAPAASAKFVSADQTLNAASTAATIAQTITTLNTNITNATTLQGQILNVFSLADAQGLVTNAQSIADSINSSSSQSVMPIMNVNSVTQAFAQQQQQQQPTDPKIQGQTDGTADGTNQKPISYKSTDKNYHAAYDAAYYPARGTKDGTAAGAKRPAAKKYAFTPIGKFPAYQKAYDAAFAVASKKK